MPPPRPLRALPSEPDSEGLDAAEAGPSEAALDEPSGAFAGADYEDVETHETGREDDDLPLSEEIFELRRGALWEDVIHGCWLAGLLGTLLFPIIGLMLAQAGALDVGSQLRGFVLSGLLLMAMNYARTRVSSRMVIDPTEGSVHDAVRIGRTLYLQGSIPFDRIEGIELVRRERRRVLSDQDPEQDTPLEGRGRLRLGASTAALTNWVSEDYSRGAPWLRLRADLRRVARVTGAELTEAEDIEPPVWELGRYLVWIVSIALTAAALVVVGA